MKTRECKKIAEDVYLVPLTRGKNAIVDLTGLEKVCQYNWFYNNGYAYRGMRDKKTKKIKLVSMHRFIMDSPEDMMTDHVNGDTLDNRIPNLRICCHKENMRNRRGQKGTSVYKGVCLERSTGKWKAYIRFNGVLKNIGRFHLEKEAAEAYNKKAIELHGEFAKTNEIY